MSTYTEIHEWVRRVPEGMVATYGQIARLVGTSARQVGYALAALSVDTEVPWHRIINSQGRLSLRAGGAEPELQRLLLEAEDVVLSPDGKVDLAIYRCPDDELLQ